MKDTCSMPAFKRTHLIPALLLCSISLHACTPAHTQKAPASVESIESTTLSPTFDKSVQEKTEREFWDVKNVDISEIDLQRKLIAFSFDDAPSRTLENILAVFAAYNDKNEDCKASATIFFNGARFSRETTHLLYSALALGFELGNHTHSHYDLTTLDPPSLSMEIEKTDALLEKADGRKHHLLRAPFGRVNEQVKACAKAPIIDWTIDTLDWTNASAEEIYDSVFNNRFSGAIVLMHDGYEGTVSALKRLLPDLKADGYQVVSISKMIKAHNCKFRNGGVYIRARKQK
jgi:peptidoglycan/xylan/chitin deacetylase (PgdA/CDA1 family)